MFANNQEVTQEWLRSGQKAFEYWVSFWPTAPIFGVKWRFADQVGALMTPNPAGRTKTQSKARPSGYQKKTETAPRNEPSRNTMTRPQQAAPVSERVVPSAVMTTLKTAKEDTAAAKPQTRSANSATTSLKQKDGDLFGKTDDGAFEKPALTKPSNLFDECPNAPSDLKLIKGIGPGLEKQLNALGVYTFEQMASFSTPDLEWIDAQLTAFNGRCFRDDWVGQAKAQLG